MGCNGVDWGAVRWIEVVPKRAADWGGLGRSEVDWAGLERSEVEWDAVR